MEIFRLLQEAQKVRLEITWGARLSDEITDFSASSTFPRTSYQGPHGHTFHIDSTNSKLHGWHPDRESSTDCTEDRGSQVAAGTRRCSVKCTEKVEASEYISRARMTVGICYAREHDAKYRLINRVERLQASRAAIEVEMAMRLVLRDRPSVRCCNTTLSRTSEAH